MQCSQCKAVFAVQVQPIALNTSGQAPLAKRSRKRKTGDKGGGSNDAPARTLSAYNVFMKCEVAKVKNEHPELPHREAFKLVSAACCPPGTCPSACMLSARAHVRTCARVVGPRVGLGGAILPLSTSSPSRCEVAHISRLPFCAAIPQAAERWQSSPMNPQNGGERFPLKQSTTPPMVMTDTGLDGPAEDGEPSGAMLDSGPSNTDNPPPSPDDGDYDSAGEGEEGLGGEGDDDDDDGEEG